MVLRTREVDQAACNSSKSIDLINPEQNKLKIETPNIWESLSNQIEKLLRENIESTDTLKAVSFKSGKEIQAEDLRVLRDTLTNCMGTQNVILYMLYMISEIMKQTPERVRKANDEHMLQE